MALAGPSAHGASPLVSSWQAPFPPSPHPQFNCHLQRHTSPSMFLSVFYLCGLSVCLVALTRIVAAFVCLRVCRLPPPVDSEACAGCGGGGGGLWACQYSWPRPRRQAPEEEQPNSCHTGSWSRPVPARPTSPRMCSALPACPQAGGPNVLVERRQLWARSQLGHLITMRPWAVSFTFLSLSLLICKMGLRKDGLARA